MSDAQQLQDEFEKAVEADDNETAALKLGQIEELENTVQEVSQMSQGISITKASIGIGAFEPVLASLTAEEIDALQVEVVDDRDPATLTPEQRDEVGDLSAMILPGTSVLDAEHRIHLNQRGDVKRAARGLAIAAAQGVDLDSQIILSNSGSSYTIDAGICFELRQTEQPDFSGQVTILEQRVPCKGHLVYKKLEKGFQETGESHMRCLHQWALMFSLGYFVTASKSVFFDKLIITTEIAQRVGDESARQAAQTQIAEWVSASTDRREVRTGFAQAINARRQELGLAEGSYLPPTTEIAGMDLASGGTVAEGVTSLRGRQFALKVSIPMNGNTLVRTTRTVKNMAELASAVAPHFAVARQNDGALLALELIAR